MTLTSIRRFWQSVPYRLLGTHIGVESEPLTSVPAKAVFPADANLEAMVRAARGVVLARGIQVDKRKPKLIEDQPTAFKRPADVPEDTFPIG